MNTVDNKKFCRKYHGEQIKYIANALGRRVCNKNIFEQHYDRAIMDGEQGNAFIYESLMADQPFLAGRFGGNEIRVVSDFLFEQAGGRLGGLSKRMRYKIVNQAGFFPDDKELIFRFAKTYLESSKYVDLLGAWNMFLQSEIIKGYLPETSLCILRALEPYYYENPWSIALKGKKVLVIHPFAESIASQYKKREYLFKNPNILPEFELRTVKAVQSIAGERDERFATWFDALDSMYSSAMEKDFEIALIGCGAYGLPLAAKLKQAGKKIVHMGGALQLLFGIKGKRWDNHEVIGKLYNEYWVRPSESEVVKKADVVEGGCYW